MSPYRIVLADDSISLRQEIKKMIAASGDVQVVGEAGDGLDLLNLLKTVTADMIILDISMPNLKGVEASREIQRIQPEIDILILSQVKKKEHLYQAFPIDANGFLFKEDIVAELFSAIETVRQGSLYVSPLLSRELSIDLIEKYNGLGHKFSDGPLTAREKEILTLLAEGKSSKEIAGFFSISARTVQHHRANIMKKLKLKRVAGLVKYAIRNGYTSFINF